MGESTIIIKMQTYVKLMRIYLPKKKKNLKTRSKVDSNEDENFGFVGTLTQNTQVICVFLVRI
jgi:hypothetical protein